MKNDCGKGVAGGDDGKTAMPRPARGSNGIFPTSFRTLSRIVSSGASSVASTVKTAASAAAAAVVERDSGSSRDQVYWAGFDKLETEGGIIRQVLLLVYSYGFQVWDVEEADNVCNLVSRNDGPASFMQMLPKPLLSKKSEDRFADNRPLLIICADGSFSGDDMIQKGFGTPCNISRNPTVIWFYSLRSQSYVHLVRFRSIVHLVRCSSRIVAVLQSAQIHCLNAATLEKECTILTNPVITGYHGSGVGFGPLALGPRWMAYSGSQVATASGRVSPQHLTPSTSSSASPSNGSSVAHYAKESGKQLAAGILTLGDIGYKKLSRYYSEPSPDGHNYQSGTSRLELPGIANENLPDADNIGMVIVRDVVSRTVVTQFKAHNSPILALCFDPSGTLLVTASVHGHTINVFRVMVPALSVIPGFSMMPGLSGGSSEDASESSHVHLYTLQRGFTNAVIQDISFSTDSEWIMINSSRGTGHLFAISPSGGAVSFQPLGACFNDRNGGTSLMSKRAVSRQSNGELQVLIQQSICKPGPPITLSPVSRIRNGTNGWIDSVSGVASVATGWTNSLSGAIASAFQNCKRMDWEGNSSSSKTYQLLIFSPGRMTQYAVRSSPRVLRMASLHGKSTIPESVLDSEGKILVEALQQWNICKSQSHRDQVGNPDIYGENGKLDDNITSPGRMREKSGVFPDVMRTSMKSKMTSDEKNNMYISQAELQMHQPQNPLWLRSEIYFQLMLAAGFNIEEEGACGGEPEIGSIPISMLEAKVKDLVPVLHYLQPPKLESGRDLDGNNHQLVPEESEVANDGKASRSNAFYLNSINHGVVVADNYDHKETGQQGFHVPPEMIRGCVHTNDTPVLDIRHENVNTRDNYLTENQLRSVNNRDSLEMDNQSEQGEEFG